MTVDEEIRALEPAELRAKYNQADRSEMAKNGSAMSDGSYPIKDAEDLSDAIRAVGRGSNNSHATIRKHIMARANALGLEDRIPDSWNADGTLNESKGVAWTLEQRDTATDVFTALSGCVADAFPTNYCWVQDWYGGQDDGYCVVYYCQGELWQDAFTYDNDGKYVLGGEPVRVRPVTSFAEREEQQQAEVRSAVELDGRQVAESAVRQLTRHTMELRKARMPRRGEREVRTLPLEELRISENEVRAQDPTSADGRPLLRFTGYASVFDRRYSVGLYEEVIQPGAFKRTLQNDHLDCVLRIEHQDLPLARTTGSVTLADGTEQRTLSLTEDSTGLRVEALLDPEDPDVQRLVPKFRRGDLKEMSFAFRCTDDVWSDDYGLRTIRSADINRGDVAIVTYGASPSTTSELRSEAAASALRGLGFSRFIEAMAEWRDYTLLSEEERAGKTLSASTVSFLREMLDLFTTADEAVDEGQARLADFLGVPNPDADADDEAAGEAEADTDERAEAEEPETREDDEAVGEFVPRDNEFLMELRMLGGNR